MSEIFTRLEVKVSPKGRWRGYWSGLRKLLLDNRDAEQLSTDEMDALEERYWIFAEWGEINILCLCAMPPKGLRQCRALRYWFTERGVKENRTILEQTIEFCQDEGIPVRVVCTDSPGWIEWREPYEGRQVATLTRPENTRILAQLPGDDECTT